MDKSKKIELWEKAADFHGHVCRGLTIGYKAALYAIELLDINFSEDEEIVCISENDACGVDAIQTILGCSIGKGNLLFHMTGKQAFSFYDRKSGKSIRLVLKNFDENLSREEAFDFYQGLEAKDMFDLGNTKIFLPEKARIFDSITCETCGEKTSENYIRIQDNKKVCVDCADKYNRFKILGS